MSDLNHILSNENLVDQLMAHLENDAGQEVLARQGVPADPLKSTVESLARGLESNVTLAQEAIIRKFGRPVLYIQDDAIQLPADVLPLWKDHLVKAKETLERVLPSVGRIELRGHPRYSWVGTGWLIAPRLIATNRHVAEVFARADGDAFKFRADPVGKRMRAQVDLCQEHERANEREIQIKEVLHIEPEEGYDVALLRVASRDDDDQELPAPIPLATTDPTNEQIVGAVGYAGWDGSRNARDVMDRIFDNVYEVKRLHPGEIMEVHRQYANHDCSTLGGNSGSVVLDFATGQAVALHYAGQYESRNYAVKATALHEILGRRGIDIGRGV